MLNHPRPSNRHPCWTSTGMADARRETHPHNPPFEQDESHPSESIESPLEVEPLEYPQLLLNTSFTSLLAHSIPSNPSSSTTTLTKMPSSSSSSSAARTRASTPPPLGSLSESWVISDAEFSLDDDLQSEQTDASSLLEVHSTDDDHSIRAEDDTQDDGGELVPAPEMIQEDAEEKADEHPASAHETGSLSESSILPGQINLDVFATMDDKTVYAAQVIKGIDPEGAITHNPEGQPYSITCEKVVMTLSKDTLKDHGRRNLQVLFMGTDYYSSMRRSIVSKIADAFVTSNSFQDSTQSIPRVRYHIVPDVFGPGSEPSTAEAIPIECQLEVLNCHGAVDRGNGRIVVWNGESDTCFHSAPSENGRAFIVHERYWTRPDFAILVVSNTDSEKDRKSNIAMSQFARNLNIPLLVLMMEDDDKYLGGSFSMEPRRACRIVEHVSNDKHEFVHLPLNLDTFFRLNANQLSRHLNFLAESGGEPHQPDDPKPSSGEWLLQSGSTALRWVAQEVPPKCRACWAYAKRNQLHFIGLLCFMLVGTLLTTANREVQVLAGIPTALNKSANLNDSAPPIVSDTPKTKVVSLGLVNSLSHITIDGVKPMTELLDVEKVDSEHLVIRIPHQSKRAVAPNVTILRDDHVIEADVRVWRPNVFSVQVAEHEMHGNLTVRIWTRDPRHVQTAQIYLGTLPFHLQAKEWLGRAESRIRQLVGRPDDQQRVAKQAHNLVKAIVTQVQLCQAQMARVDKRREDFNEFLDQKGSELMDYLSTSPLVSTRWSDQIKAKFANVTRDIAENYNPTMLRRRIQKALEDLHENLRSETLSVAQDRAQGIAQGLKKRKT
jgi:hypothetical protein